jgi:glutathione S-transferase
MTTELYCFGESGNAYKVALTLQLLGRPWVARKVDFFGGETRQPAFRALNPMGEVPVLIDTDGSVLTQSGMIQIHLAEAAGRMLGHGPDQRREVLRWLFWDNHKMSAQAGALRFQMNFLAPEKRSEGAIAFLHGRVQAALETLAAQLQRNDWIAGTDGPTIADCAACGYLFYPEPFGFDRAGWPSIDAWLARIEALPGWMHPYALMPGNPSDRAH